MKVFAYLISVVANLPGWVKVLLYLLFSAMVIAIAGYFGIRSAIIAAAIMLVLGIALILYGLLARWVRERKAAELRGEFDQNASLPDPHETERIQALHRAFDDGLGKFQVSGKELYELPWFLVVGEPGVGKTSAIRNAEVELARNIHGDDEPQEANRPLNWWFTNYAVLLDTPGDMLFGGGGRATTSEWRELGRLLSESRPNVPINGLILAISADSLLHDSEEAIEEKAGVIARHLDTMRHDLGVVFPVFVMITKADLLPGFRGFFEELRDPETAYQIFGWSNPAPIEAPFRPELAVEYMQTVSQRLRRRRLGLLLDPVPRQKGDRRIDEVDTLFELPTVLQKILPNFRRHLENIFVPGQWTSRPLFLRGVYLTSALQKFDPTADMLAARGAARTESPSDTIEKPRSFFLRDFFLDKVFREDALVTRAGTNSGQLTQKRILIFLLGILLLAGLFLLSINAHNHLYEKVLSQIPTWDRATLGWSNDGWMPIVSPDRYNPDAYRYNGDSPIGTGLEKGKMAEFPLKDESLVDFHSHLMKLAATSIDIPVVFQPYLLFTTNPDTGRYRAQRVLFENSVVKPLLVAARRKMSKPLPENLQDTSQKNLSAREALLAYEAKALTELVRVEVSILAREQHTHTVNPGSTFVPSLLDYVANVRDNDQLTRIMNWTYGANPAGVNKWAPDWTSGGNTLETNTAINAGIDRLIDYAKQRVSQLQLDLATLNNLEKAAQDYSQAEDKLAQAASKAGPDSNGEQLVGNALQKLGLQKQELEKSLNLVRSKGLFEDGPETLSAALNNLSSGSNTHLGQVDVILSLVESALPAAAQSTLDANPAASTGSPSDGSSDSAANATPSPTATPGTTLSILLSKNENLKRYQLLIQIRDRLQGISGLINQKTKEQITDKTIASYRQMDAEIFAPFDGQPSYIWRWNHYKECATAGDNYLFQDGMYLVDQRWVQLSNLLAKLNSVQDEVDAYSGGQAANFLTICNFFLDRIRSTQTRIFMTNYVQQARAALLRVARFPLVYPPGPDNEALSVDQLQGAQSLLDAISADMKSPTFTQLTKTDTQPVLDFAASITPLYNIVGALIKPDGSISNVTISLYGGQAQTQLSGPNFAPPPTPTPTPSPTPRSLISKVFGGPQPTPTPEPTDTLNLSNWNAVSLIVDGSTGGVYPLYAQSQTELGQYPLEQGFSFEVFHSLTADDGSSRIDGGDNWSALRLIARLGGKPLGVGQEWQVALKPKEPIAVWVLFSFDLALPTDPWPTIDSLGLRQPAGQPAPTPQPTPAVSTNTP